MQQISHSAFTSADVAFSIQTLKQYHPRGRATFANVEGVRTPDANTAIVVLSKPAPYLLTALAGTESPIVPKHLYEGTDVATNKANSAPIGTGPFVFKEWVRGSHITLERNPNYWDKGKPYLDRIIFKVVPDAGTRAVALETGEAQYAVYSPVPPKEAQRLRESGKVAIETNGTRPLPAGLDWVCVSPKAGAPLQQTSGQELKLVYPQATQLPETVAHLSFEHFYLQPMDGPQRAANTQAAIAYCLAHPRWKLSLQSHKVINIR